MKATELMIGDWANITYKNGYGETISKNFRVTQIRESAFRNVAQEAWSDDGNMGDNINGIPLTPEILEKNGFVPFGFGWRHTSASIKIHVYEDEMSLSLIGEDAYVHNDDIKYVHELQHALLLCGLNELADNFKI